VASRVLIVDDHSVFRSRARLLLEVAGLEPDVVLLDIQLPDRDGFAVADELSRGVHPPQVVLISSREATDFGGRLPDANSRGFIHKPELSRDSLEACLVDPF